MNLLVLCYSIIGILGALAGVVFGLWCLVIAFRTSVWWGLACMFIPLAGLVFAATHWDQTGKQFLGGVCGMTAVIIVSVMLPGARGSMPQLGGGGWAAPSADTIKNMKMVQIAAESYATDHGGSYPPNIELFKCYFPEGRAPSTDGKPPVNCVTHQPEWPVEGSVTDVAAARTAPPGPVKAGAVEYSVIRDAGHQPISYAVRGGDADGRALPSPRDKATTLVLSNQ